MTYFQHSEKSEIKYIVLLTTLILIVAGVLYKDFLVGEKLYIYADQGCDTLNSYWPFYGYLYKCNKVPQPEFLVICRWTGKQYFYQY